MWVAGIILVLIYSYLIGYESGQFVDRWRGNATRTGDNRNDSTS